MESQLVANKTYCFENCDILFHQNSIQENGFDKNLSFEEIRDIAIYNRCPIIVKNGSGKWYLKGFMKEIDEIKTTIMKNKNQYKGKILYFIDFSQFQ